MKTLTRRETLKSLLLAPLAGGVIASTGCIASSNSAAEITWSSLPKSYSYGRTEAEKLRDQKLFSETYFREHELLTIAVLCDIILPSDHPNGGALDAGLPEFVEFMVKDRERYKLPIRGGIAWLDNRAIDRFGADFINVTESQRLSLCDEIAYPDVKDAELQAGISFFSFMRNLTLTGYYTTAEGFKDLGYKGNTPNIWDGVPESVLQKHNVAYEAEWLEKCVDQSRRDIIAQWDDEMNLIS
ncbi:MAG: Tat pathway signal protein [SAR86 cluster bacterium]|uniref:Tat pathway signal protein n=1 Tax=SAR86 cluster bacterium TaxID=2030880 RepID=A0A2A5ARZ6_9GAMM|nr:MAG: Tat pathway signal protein [SAR86 cluster bacterium]